MGVLENRSLIDIAWGRAVIKNESQKIKNADQKNAQDMSGVSGVPGQVATGRNVTRCVMMLRAKEEKKQRQKQGGSVLTNHANKMEGGASGMTGDFAMSFAKK